MCLYELILASMALVAYETQEYRHVQKTKIINIRLCFFFDRGDFGDGAAESMPRSHFQGIVYEMT